MTVYTPCCKSLPNCSTLWFFQSSTLPINSSSASSKTLRSTASFAFLRIRSAEAIPAVRSALADSSSLFFVTSFNRSWCWLDQVNKRFEEVTNLEQQWIFDKSLHWLQQKTIKGVEVTCNRMCRLLYLIEDLFCQRSSFTLVGYEGLVDVESFLECNERIAP